MSDQLLKGANIRIQNRNRVAGEEEVLMNDQKLWPCDPIRLDAVSRVTARIP